MADTMFVQANLLLITFDNIAQAVTLEPDVYFLNSYWRGVRDLGLDIALVYGTTLFPTSQPLIAHCT